MHETAFYIHVNACGHRLERDHAGLHHGGTQLTVKLPVLLAQWLDLADKAELAKGGQFQLLSNLG